MMDFIINNVIANENLYRSIEFDIIEHYTLVKPKYTEDGFVKSSRTTMHLVHQDRMLFQNEKHANILIDVQYIETNTLQGFDGLTTRAQVDSIANIRDGPPSASWRLVRPHTILLSDNAYLSFPLSVFLQGAPGVSSPIYGPHSLKVDYAGNESVDGLNCHKVRCEVRSSGDPSSAPSIRFIWICQDRNYLPIKTEHYRSNWLGNYPPSETGEIVSLREIDDGIWVPVKLKVVVYDANYQTEDNVREINNTREWDIEVKSFPSNYSVEFLAHEGNTVRSA